MHSMLIDMHCILYRFNGVVVKYKQNSDRSFMKSEEGVVGTNHMPALRLRINPDSRSTSINLFSKLET